MDLREVLAQLRKELEAIDSAIFNLERLEKDHRGPGQPPGPAGGCQSTATVTRLPSVWNGQILLAAAGVQKRKRSGEGRRSLDVHSYCDGSFPRVAWTPFRMASPRSMIAPTAIQWAATCRITAP